MVVVPAGCLYRHGLAGLGPRRGPCGLGNRTTRNFAIVNYRCGLSYISLRWARPFVGLCWHTGELRWLAVGPIEEHQNRDYSAGHRCRTRPLA